MVEGKKNLEEARHFLEFTFTDKDTKHFDKLVETITPQDIAGLARIPRWTMANLSERPRIVVLDGVQDPGNVGTILRLCLGFDASLLLIESADPSSAKVIRSSAGAFFRVPWVEVDRSEAEAAITQLERPIFKLQKSKDGEKNIKQLAKTKELILIAGSEGRGIRLTIPGVPVTINHNPLLESLNVATAVAIALAQGRL